MALSGLQSGRPTLGFTLSAGQNAGPIYALTIRLPRGLSFNEVHRRISDISVSGAQVAKLSLSYGQLTITLGAPATAVTVDAGVKAIGETPALARAVHASKVTRVTFSVVSWQDAALPLFSRVAL